MTRGHQIAALAILVLAVFLGWQATRLTYYSPLGPGAGFFPIWLCIVLAFLAVSVLVSATIARAPLPDEFWPERAGVLRIAFVLAGLVFVVAALKPLGFRLTSLLFTATLLPALGRRNPIEIAAVALFASFGVYALFVDQLRLSLPIGMFGF
jgi:putative tricarboxylic transport membrane protein